MQVQDMIYKEYIIYSPVNKMSRDMSIKVILCSDFYNSLCTEINKLINKLVYRNIIQNVVIKVTDSDIAQMLKEYFKGQHFINVVHYPNGSIYFHNPQDFFIEVLEDSCGYVVIYDSRVTLDYWAAYFINNDFEDTLFDAINTNYTFRPIYKKYLI